MVRDRYTRSQRSNTTETADLDNDAAFYIPNGTTLFIPDTKGKLYQAKVIKQKENKTLVSFTGYNKSQNQWYDSLSIWTYLRFKDQLQNENYIKVETEQEIEESMAAITTTGLTQQMQELALETDIIETEEAEKILEECYPITTTAFISESADKKLWVQTWNVVCNNPCKHYFLPKGKIGKLYVESLNDELNSFLESNSPSEKFLVYSSLILHYTSIAGKASRDFTREADA